MVQCVQRCSSAGEPGVERLTRREVSPLRPPLVREELICGRLSPVGLLLLEQSGVLAHLTDLDQSLHHQRVDLAVRAQPAEVGLREDDDLGDALVGRRVDHPVDELGALGSDLVLLHLHRIQQVLVRERSDRGELVESLRCQLHLPRRRLGGTRPRLATWRRRPLSALLRVSRPVTPGLLCRLLTRGVADRVARHPGLLAVGHGFLT